MLRSDIYKAIRDHAKMTLPYLRVCDLQKGQFVNPEQNYPLPLPALLVEFQGFRFVNLGEQQQKGDGTVSIYLYINLVTDSLAGAERENETIALLDYMDGIYQTFEGFRIEGMTPLNRISEAKPQYGKRFIMFRVDFTTTVDDGKIRGSHTAPRPEPDISAEYKF
jgi:hypothetical protein